MLIIGRIDWLSGGDVEGRGERDIFIEVLSFNLKNKSLVLIFIRLQPGKTIV
jgi:hypothetical protein